VVVTATDILLTDLCVSSSGLGFDFGFDLDKTLEATIPIIILLNGYGCGFDYTQQYICRQSAITNLHLHNTTSAKVQCLDVIINV